ncbi:MAG: transcription termination/antitermination protein NusA [Clostridia bacterium]|nr:transcription termination/antitermination protein NusA [Clostridia bacterium]
MKSEIIEAVEALAREKDISAELLYTTIEDAVKTAYKKNLPKGQVEPANIVVQLNRDNGQIHVFARMIVAPVVENEASQITLEAAQKIRPSAQVDDIVEVDVTPKGFLRVAAMSARQVIVQRIRTAERGKVYDQMSDKTDEILTGVVMKLENFGALVELDRTEGVLETAEMIPGEELHEGDHVKVYVLEVQRTLPVGQKLPQVRVSRIHPNLVKRLFEMEVPEISMGDVTIKSIAREAGSRTKMAVAATIPDVDPVGSCVGQKGARVDRVVAELKGEKIDIIKWSDNPAEFVANALNPAHVLAVYIAEGVKMCRVIVPDNQLSLAIGKEGQNVRLAAKLTGWKIDIKSQSQAATLTDMMDENGEFTPVEDEFEMPSYESFTDEMVDLPEDEDDTM